MLSLRPAQTRATRDRPRLATRTRPGTAAPIAEQPNPRFESKARRRELLNLLRVANAAKHLDHMPEPGCSIHGIMRGNYSFCDLIPAVLRLIQPARLEYVAATTLGFSRKAALQLIDLLDAGHVQRIDFICADFFEKADSEICQFARAELTSRGSRFTAARCHAKIILLAADNGDRYTSESSANIRACRSIEQFALTNDPDLYEFHRQWIDEIFHAPEKANQA
jgi:hypothetical protein